MDTALRQSPTAHQGTCRSYESLATLSTSCGTL
jgi:hypothetical protein